MKRSEAADVVLSILLDIENSCPSLDDAEKIIEKLENLGMLPPNNPKNRADWPNYTYEWEKE